MSADKKNSGSRIVSPPLAGRKANLDDPAAQAFMRTGHAPVPEADVTTQPETRTVEEGGATEEGAAAVTPFQPVAKNSWDDLPNMKASRQNVVRLTDYEADILSFLGDTTRGETMQSITRRAIQKELKRMMAERGFKVTFNDPTKK